MSAPSSQKRIQMSEPDVIHSVKSQVDIVREIELPMVHKRLDDLQHDVRENRQSIKDLSNKMDTNTWWIVGTIIFSVLIPILISNIP
jgi:hypothetical protein